MNLYGKRTAETKGIVALYGKRGCKGNQRQIQMLNEAGYVVQFVDLLSGKLEAAELQKFLNDQAIHDCVNVRAPAVSSGAFQADTLSEEELLQAMVEDPILIKRPLLFFRGQFACGFDHPLATQLLGEPPPETGCQKDEPCDHN